MTDRRIGVYVCHCGGNISDVVDVKKVVEAVKDEPGVVVAKDFMFMCSDAGQQMVQDDIKALNLNGVVVAACSPKLHEMTFRNCVSRAGLNPYLFYHANIREDSSWAHSDDPQLATLKAIDHVKAAIAYVRNAHPLEKIRVRSTPSVLIVGAGIAGMKAALTLADMGVSVFLVEREPFVGGRVAQIGRIYPDGKRGIEIVRWFIKEIERRDNIAVYTNAELKSVEGYVGNFRVKLTLHPRYVKFSSPKLEMAIKECPIEVPDEFNYGLVKRKAIYRPYAGSFPNTPVIDMKHCNLCGKCKDICPDCIDFNQKPETVTLKVGAIIVATGFDPYEPKEGEFGYKTYSEVVTLPRFIRAVELNRTKELIYDGKKVRDIAFIYCVGSRQKRKSEDEHVNEYCSRYCCNAAVYNSLTLLERFPYLRLYHIFKDMRTYGKNEAYYEELGRKGAIFFRFDDDRPPMVSRKRGKLTVTVYDRMIDEQVDIPVDLVVLVVGMVPRKNDGLNKVLKLSASRDGFYQEVHPKLRPVETIMNGILIAGSCQGPKDVTETIASASAAAGKAAALVVKEYLTLEPFVAYVNPDICDLNGKCIDECKYNAIEIREYEGKGRKAWVNEALCKGCGACVPACPKGAIQLRGFETEKIKEMIRVMAR